MFDLDTNVETVSQLTQKIKGKLETDFSNIKVSGEISNYTAASSGHKYFTLKDDKAQISCVMWRSTRVAFPLESGKKVEISGSISVYPPRGSYQLVVSSVREKGLGDLHLAYEKLKQELFELGYFDAENKKQWNIIPQKIGVSTSATGAAIRDILSTLERRAPFAEIYFYPVMVQGTGSENQIAKAINELDKLDLDVLIIGRGGGSIEDLWSYNTKVVADAIYNAKTPIVAGVGHETDTTIADLVADHRAPTPTGAAEIVSVNTIDVIRQTLDENSTQIKNIISKSLDEKMNQLDNIADKLMRTNVKNTLNNYSTLLSNLESYLNKGIENKISHITTKFDNYNKLFTKIDPRIPLRKGYSVIEKDGKRIKSEEILSVDDTVSIIRLNQKNTAIIKE
jgi:exodeoxyribonuclease VII large subunit